MGERPDWPPESRDPETREDWQEAVDAAHGLLALQAAREYGLVTGGPDVNAERCMEILNEGLRLSPPIRPRIDSIEKVVRELSEQHV